MPSLDGVQGIEDLDLEGRRLLVRVDYNVPLDDSGAVADDERIVRSLPTLRHAVERGAKVVLASHLGRPRGPDPRLGLEPCGARLSELTGWEVLLPDDCVGEAARKVVLDAHRGQVVLLENLRFHPGEEADDEAFARQLARLGDAYVNDAFGAAHRAHASVHALPRLFRDRAMGCLLRDELRSLRRVTEAPERPFVAVLGGAKVADKIGVLDALTARCDVLCIGGAMANTMLAAQGHRLGASRVEADRLAFARSLLARAVDRGVDVLLPTDVVVAGALDADRGRVVDVGALEEADLALDIGPRTVERFSAAIARARTVFWNGPMGLFERAPFAAGTLGVAAALAASPAFTVVGGGDSAAAVRRAGEEVASRIGFISTGGGAALELVEGKALPGVQALRRSPS